MWRKLQPPKLNVRIVMEEVQIEVKYVNPPKQAGWSGSIKGSDGEYYNVPDECLGNFRVGELINLGYENRQVQKGKWTGKWVRDAKLKNGQPLQTGLPGPVPEYQPNPTPLPVGAAPIAPADPAPVAPPPPILSNVLAAAVSSGVAAVPEDLLKWARYLKMAVDVYGNPTQHADAGPATSGMTGAPSADLDDEIPF